jgi:hypothetical protein
MSKNILYVSDAMIKDRTAIHGNIDPKLIYPDIKVAQDMYIHPALGTALFNKIQTLIEDETISDAGNAIYKTLLDRYIVDALMYFTLAELPTTISYQFWNKGVIRKQGLDTDLPSMDELISLQNKYKDRGEFYLERLRLYLKQNQTSFPEYINPGSGVDDIHPSHNAFTMPVYLGDDCGCNKSYEEKYQGNKPSC